MDQHPNYEVGNLLGENHYAAVYEGRDRTVRNRPVAIMTLKPEFRSEPGRWGEIWDQVCTLADAKIENVVPVQDKIRELGWLILPKLQPRLADRMKAEAAPPGEVRRVLRTVLKGLIGYESKDVSHGDIKPQNLLTDGQKLYLSFSPGLKLGGQMLFRKNDFRHISPELLQKEFGPVGPQVDLYALGFTAYELLLGPKFETLSVFRGLKLGGDMHDHFWMQWHTTRTEALPSIAETLPGCPADLVKVIDRLTRKNVAERYASAKEALDDLEDTIVTPSPRPVTTASYVATAGRVPAKQPLGKRIGKVWKKYGTSILTGLAFLAVIALLWAFLPGDTPSTDPKTERPVQLIVESEPSGASVEIQGKSDVAKMRTPARYNSLPFGQDLTVTLMLNGYQPYVEKFSLSNDRKEPRKLQVTLQKQAAGNSQGRNTASASLPKNLVPAPKTTFDASGLPLRAIAPGTGDPPLEFVLFKPGRFRYGVSGDRRSGELADRDEVIEQAFYLSTTEVSVAQFARFLKEANRDAGEWTPSENPALAAGGIPYDLAKAYSAWVSPNGRLPSEKEWEYAARNGSDRQFPWGDEPITPERANLALTESPEPAKAREANGPAAGNSPEGLQNLLGNLAEWTNDVYEKGFGESDQDPGVGSYPAVRGGSYLIHADDARITYRSNADPAGRPYVGVRVLIPVSSRGPEA